ncbi:MAG: PHP domain-containing protein [Actinomycetes bacterium]
MIDLHTHSATSDGTDTPGELINKALARGLDVVALTDHDTIAGWDEALRYLRPNLDLVLGSEISCQTEDGISVHMLGLLFDPDYLPLQEVMAQTRDNRHGRMEKIIRRLNDNGYQIEMSDVLAQLSEGATLGRPHLADALIAKGLVKNREEAFAELLHNNSRFYVSHYSPTPEEVIRLIKSAGGVAVIAHPLASLRGRTIEPAVIQSLVGAGLDGIEVHHRDQNLEERELLSHIARDFDLVVTGSSDYHGTGKLNVLAESTTDPQQWEALESRARERRVISL